MSKTATRPNIDAMTLVPFFVSKAKNRLAAEVAALFLGVTLIGLLAQVAIPLPWTPVPITGQTFGVALTALLWGRKRAVAVMIAYLAAGVAGLPVFATTFSFGATNGYLMGMFFSALLVGELADRGFTRTWGQAFLAAALGSVLTFTFGLIVLSFFVPREMLFTAGLLPFLPGDFIKNSLAAWLATRSSRLTTEV